MLKDKKLFIRYILSIIGIFSMIFVADLFHESEIIFPEIAALFTGLWVIDKHVWNVNKLQMLLLTTLMAVVGTILILYSPFGDILNLSIALCVAAVVLITSKTDIYPIISAAALPIILHVGSWIYPLAVFCLCAVIALGQYLLELSSIRTYKYRREVAGKELSQLLKKWFIIIPIIVLYAILPINTGHRFLILPPLIVTFVEFTKIGSGVRKQPYIIILLIFISAVLGTFSVEILHREMGWNIALASVVSIICVYSLFEIFERRFAPAAAISLVPCILPPTNIWNFPIEVTLGSAALIAIAMLVWWEPRKIKNN